MVQDQGSEKTKLHVPESDEAEVQVPDSEEDRTVVVIECEPMYLPGQRGAREEWQVSKEEAG